MKSITVKYRHNLAAKVRKSLKDRWAQGYPTAEQFVAACLEDWGQFNVSNVKQTVSPTFAKEELWCYIAVFYSEKDAYKAFKRMGLWVDSYDKETALYQVKDGAKTAHIKAEYGDKLKLTRVKL